MDTIDENAINIYTDGSSYQTPRRGGIGFRYVTVDHDGHEVIHDYEPQGYRGANNQQMELLACIEALNTLSLRGSPLDPKDFTKIIIKTDSMYVVNNYGSATFSWPTTKWTTRDGTPVANADLWKQLVKSAKTTGRRVEIKWVKGHKLSVHNRAVDKLAKKSARSASKDPITVVSVRRKKSAKSVEIGSVGLTGQRLTIRIITDQWLKVQRCWRFKYEVTSKASPFYQNVDVAYSDILLRAGHTYYVRFGDDTKNPRILKLFKEVLPRAG